VYKNIKKYRDHHAVYESWFKFQSGEDTSYSVIDIRLYTLIGQPAYSILTNITEYDTILSAKKPNYITSLYVHNDKYYTMNTDKYSLSVISNDIKDDVYKGIRKNKKSLKSFKLGPDTSVRYHILINNSEYKDKRDTVIYKTILYVDKTNMMPMIQEDWAWFDGGVQYSLQKLKSIEILDRNKLNYIVKEIDSLSSAFKTHINGDSLNEAFYAKFKKHQIGDTMKPISGKISMSNDSFNLFTHGDSILIIDFSYTTCGWCIYCIPALNALHQRYDSTGVAVYSVDPMKNDWNKIEKFVAYFKIKYPIVEIDYDFSYEYGVLGYPTLFIIKNGILVYMHRGFSENMEEEIIKEVNKALGKT
ncbi:MAG: TlpA family protein disulfide reductase, partial [Bacteroidia bacterium]|nr:TlpA family protein disulfide reductase [Bacteroidia bacterium]